MESRRDYKDFAAGEYYHIFNRGNGKMNIFRDPDDYIFFLFRLKEYLFPEWKRRRAPSAVSKVERNERSSFPEESFSLVSYCLMPNHFHLLIGQNTDVSISALMLRLSGSYVKFFNKKYERVGSLFQDQFKSVHVESNPQLLHLSAYIHLNPFTAGLIKTPDAPYPYSSYPEYVGVREGTLCRKEIILDQFENHPDYATFVAESAETVERNKEIKDLLLD
jgi:putative transposase